MVPEWYFLPFYAMLRSIPNKLFGVLVLVFSIIIMCVVPFSFLKNPTSRIFIYSPIYKFLFWSFFFNCLILGWIGGKSIETPYYEIGQGATLFYFFFFCFLSLLEVFNDKIIKLKI